MAATILSWVFVFCVFLITGTTVSECIRFIIGYRITDVFSVLMTGIVCVTLYAQAFSLFYKVGQAAVTVLVLLCAAEMFFFRKRFSELIRHWAGTAKKQRGLLTVLIAVCLAVILLGAYVTSWTPRGYDSYNYHIPAIRWTEEYGVVKGLGNLHTRFAYNSAFLCLQALFSFSWLYRASMHSMNGFIWVFMALFALSRLWLFTGKRFRFSDMLRIILLVILIQHSELEYLSSPTTDFSPALLAGYVFIQWCRYGEEKVHHPEPYGLLALLGFYSATVKLSAGFLILFAVFPLIGLLRRKAYKTLLFFMTAAIAVFAPFVLRNLILSGYPVYPVYWLDPFNFDWEIPKSAIVSDHFLIKVFARSWGKDYAYEDLTRPFFQWLRIWLEKANGHYEILLGADIILAAGILLFSIRRMVSKRTAAYPDALPLIGSAGFFFLLFTAPLVRFGRWWFYLIPAFPIYFICRKERISQILSPRLSPLIPGSLISLALFGIIAVFCYKDVSSLGVSGSFLIRPRDYTMEGSSSRYAELNGIRFYYFTPDHFGRNHLNGYDGFPGTEWGMLLRRIEMRGADLSDGFKAKESMRSVPYDFRGELLTAEQLQIMGLTDDYDPSILLNYEDTALRDLLLSEQIPDEELKDHTVISGKLIYTVEDQSTDTDGIRTIDGWAFLDEAFDPEFGEICVICGDSLYTADELKRPDIASAFGLPADRVGFQASISGEGDVSVCIIDREKKIIYN